MVMLGEFAWQAKTTVLRFRCAKNLSRLSPGHGGNRLISIQMEFYKKCTAEFAGREMEKIRKVYKWLKNQF